MSNPFQKLARFFAKLRKDINGNALALTGLAMPILVGSVGYSVDTAQWYLWKRELQHSVDQAAIGGAFAKAYGTTDDYETRATQEYNANLKLTSSFASAPSVSLTSYNGGSNNSVLVSATATKRLPFSGYILGTSSTIAVTAQASFAAGGTYSACLVSLAESGTSFTVGGNATVVADCGLGALSCSPDAIKIDGSANVTTSSIVTCGTADVPSNLKSKVSSGVSGLSDEYASWTVPTMPTSTPSRSYDCTGTGQNKIASLSPGKYSGGFTISCNTTFASGVYYFDGGTYDITYNGSVVGNNVLLILKNGAKLKLGGQGNAAALQMSPMTEAQLKALGEPYASNAVNLSQMVVMQDKTGMSSQVDMTINGNVNINLSGIMYLPKTNMTVNGNASTASNLCFQITSWTLTVSGSAYLNTLCSATDTTTLGTAAARVKLVL